MHPRAPPAHHRDVADENSAIFSQEEQGRTLYHLGYLTQNVASFLSFGVLTLTQPMFIVVNALQHVPQSRVAIIRDLIAKLDTIEQKIFEAADYLVATKLEQLELRDDYPDLLEAEHTRWAHRLADALGVYVNPYSPRFYGNKPQMNYRVRTAL